MKKVFIILAISILSLSTFAQPKEFQKQALKIRSGETQFSVLGGGMFVDRISFEAKISGNCRNCELSISADGFNYTSVKLRGSGWKSYVASFSEYSRSLEILNCSKRGTVRVRNIKVLPRRLSSKGGYSGPAYDHISSGTDAYFQVVNLRNTIDYLIHQVGQRDRVKYLDPFVLVVGDAMSVLETSSDLSPDAATAVKSVIKSLEEMEPFLNSLLQTPNFSDLGREMKSIKRLLQRMLQN